MSRLIIVAGAGGAGKSFFLRLWQEHDGNAVGIKKFVSEGRAPRESEIHTGDADLIFAARYDPETKEGSEFYKTKFPGLACSKKLKFHNKKFVFSNDGCESFVTSDPYTYNYQGTYYRVDTDTIDAELSNGKTPIVIVRKSKTITNLLEKYRDALVVYVQSVLSGDDLISKLIDLGETEGDSKKRESRNKEDLDDYINNIHLLPANVRVVLNDYAKENVHKQIDDIYEEEIKNYNFKHKSIFVIQSYADGKTSSENYVMMEQAAKNYFGQAYALIKRADNRDDGAYQISDHVWESIDNSDCIICDITNDRCNCCTEEVDGMAKKTIQGTSSNVG